MTWERTPPWACPRTLRWVADQLERDARTWRKAATDCKARGNEEGYEQCHVVASGYDHAASRLRKRATRQEPSR